MRKIILTILSMVTIFACSSIKSMDVENKDFILETIEYTENNVINTIGKGMVLQFKSKKLSGKSSINNFFTSYKIENNKLILDGINLTRMAGSPEDMALESEYLNALSTNKHISKKGEKLILEAQNGMKLVYIQELNNGSLENKNFKLINSEFKEAEITIGFKENNIFGKSGINRYFSSYETENNVLFLQNIGTTLMAGAPELMELESKYLGMLNNINGIKYENKILTLYTKDNQKLIFEEIK
ncbi:META domain-containing protein [Streptobacillus notomytis]|uniref:META domain-containing protein n=1 Tax=Streptobacillus notomytis TaxID=1712031 RepID=UPI0008303FEC|nr:META domain-containing protein [Streptobacillus notomytis]